MQLIFRNVEKSLLEFLVGDYVTSYGLNDIHTMFEGFDFINDIKDAASQIAAENDEGSYVEREFKLIDPDRETAKYAKKNITAIDNNYPINQIKFGLFLEMYIEENKENDYKFLSFKKMERDDILFKNVEIVNMIKYDYGNEFGMKSPDEEESNGLWLY